jgi:hypothetical protein
MGRKTNKQKWREALSRAHTKLSPELVGKLKDAFAIGATVKQACFYAEINESTFYDWCRQNPVLKEEFDKMRNKLPLAAKHNIAAAIHNRDLFHSRWLVERQEPENYGEKVKIEHTGTLTNDGLGHPEDEEIRIAFKEKLKENIRRRAEERAKLEKEE